MLSNVRWVPKTNRHNRLSHQNHTDPGTQQQTECFLSKRQIPAVAQFLRRAELSCPKFQVLFPCSEVPPVELRDCWHPSSHLRQTALHKAVLSQLRGPSAHEYSTGKHSTTLHLPEGAAAGCCQEAALQQGSPVLSVTHGAILSRDSRNYSLDMHSSTI